MLWLGKDWIWGLASPWFLLGCTSQNQAQFPGEQGVSMCSWAKRASLAALGVVSARFMNTLLPVPQGTRKEVSE